MAGPDQAKTAILKYIHSKSEHSVEIDPSEMAMSYVSNSDALNFLHAIGADLDLLFQALWKHVLCTEFRRPTGVLKDRKRQEGRDGVRPQSSNNARQQSRF
jgi:hypothetical protein